MLFEMHRMSFLMTVAHKYILDHCADLHCSRCVPFIQKNKIKANDDILLNLMVNAIRMFSSSKSIWQYINNSKIIWNIANNRRWNIIYSIYIPFELTIPSNGAENDKWTSMWSLPHITSSEFIVGIPSGRSSGNMSLPANTKLICKKNVETDLKKFDRVLNHEIHKQFHFIPEIEIETEWWFHRFGQFRERLYKAPSTLFCVSF